MSYDAVTSCCSYRQFIFVILVLILIHITIEACSDRKWSKFFTLHHSDKFWQLDCVYSPKQPMYWVFHPFSSSLYVHKIDSWSATIITIFLIKLKHFQHAQLALASVCTVPGEFALIHAHPCFFIDFVCNCGTFKIHITFNLNTPLDCLCVLSRVSPNKGAEICLPVVCHRFKFTS